MIVAVPSVLPLPLAPAVQLVGVMCWASPAGQAGVVAAAYQYAYTHAFVAAAADQSVQQARLRRTRFEPSDN